MLVHTTLAVALALLVAPAQASTPRTGHSAETGKPVSLTETVASYPVPEVTLLDQRGEAVRLAEVLAGPEPVLMQFVFTTCSTICPIMSAGLSGARADLDAVDPAYRLLSISIDPEHDRPSMLEEYAARVGRDPRWTLLTGTADDIAKVLRAFDAYYPGNNKMYHRPYTYLRARPGDPWVRLEGLPSAGAIASRYRTLLERRPRGD